ncbi:MAG: site-2 protease family protein [Microcoleus sp. PH2017_29_MFU_D_A]|uniref:site-2 protease family protein n=1 Tax=unclassified Microcoleus TaxID=2642155 RepID=UPI001D6D9F34|nr:MULTISPECIES: site-2 protease family protein [unclassified Microcoleus]MCC3571647.1 site-2 protease family protein [Microcoleus sp. PH2017_34_RAT_O_A]MCC3586070.1 site-2 protease family protein [Microcoleus sp. PH2017_30_WIL_O_A]MCC3602574.1 site-2 protease family protein [Microcoleus sp. PH2017_29_MFU_D_A]MCC3609145.1 site-2 protease family protein [Microcoleus sp. PH2017_40_RAT_O_B]MCC3633757.1 site-2 protease family protein [Microcoleus sp. PH2017_37_MFU_D_B]
MQTGWRIGSLFGIPLLIDYSWFIILALATREYASSYRLWGSALSWSAGFAIALLLFASVLLHELGHSLAAMSQGIKVNSITLFLFGGVASIDSESKTPGQAFQVAIAGPLVSFALFLILGLGSQVFPQTSLLSIITEKVAVINLVLGLFNLIPGLPLDGGQVLKAAIWKITGSRFAGVRWAAKTGQVLGWLAVAFGVSLCLLARQYGGLWMALIGSFAIRNASSYSRFTSLQEALLKTKAADAMSREFRVVDANLSLREFADRYLLEVNPFPFYIAATNGRDLGLVSIDDIRCTERSQWQIQTLHNILQPLEKTPTVSEKASIAEVINSMEARQLPRILVLSSIGAVVGTIDRGDVMKVMAKYLKPKISEADIKHSKEENSYPLGLQLSAIAKTVQEN